MKASDSVRPLGVGWAAALVGLGLILGDWADRSAMAQSSTGVEHPLAAINAAGSRLAQEIDALDVEHRWRAGQGVDWRTGLPKVGEFILPTQSGSFVAAACEHLGVDLLHPPEHSPTKLASAQVAWLAIEGKARGWRLIGSRVQAQSLANQGFVVICQLRPHDLTRPGHAAIVRPSLRDRASLDRDGPETATAGARNSNQTPLRAAFQDHQTAADAGEILLFAHASPVTGATALDACLAGKTVGPVAASGPITATTERVVKLVETAAQVVPSGPQASLAKVMAETLPRWVSKGGEVKKAHLQALAADPRIKGEKAVALATVLHYLNKSKANSLAGERLKTITDEHRLDRSYQHLVAKLAEIRRTLFVDGVPHFDRLEQGAIGDCYLISGAGWMARYRPRRVVEMIQPLQNGRFEVHFPSGEHTVVEPPTDTEILYAESNGSLQDGLWLAVVEKAVGLLDVHRSRDEAAIPDPTIRIGVGGSARADIHRWTGHAVDVFDFKERGQARKALEALHEMERHRLMSQAETDRPHPPGPIPANHVYAVLGFDPKTELVTVWNPWGDDFTPEGPPGIQHGWPRKHGVFTLPFHDFVQVFARIAIERR